MLGKNLVKIDAFLRIRMKGVQRMKGGIRRSMWAGLLVISISVVPGVLRAQQSATQQADGFSVLGSVLLSVLHVPFKFVTCVGTQTGAAVAYTATYGVTGNYDGGTNGKQIGEVARRSCTGDWIITPEQVSKDYQ
jgi:hypothetical protein